jgi:hypothetical protein
LATISSSSGAGHLRSAARPTHVALGVLDHLVFVQRITPVADIMKITGRR